MKIFMLHSGVPGVRYYRMALPCDQLSERFGHDIYAEDTSLEGLSQSDWQSRALDPQWHENLENLTRGCDLLLAQLIHAPQSLAVLKGIRAFHDMPLVVDIDDNIEDVPAYNRGAEAYRPNSDLNNITIRQLHEADAVTVTTEHLKKVVGKYNENVYVLPNSLDIKLWDRDVEFPRKRPGQIRIGWMGAQTHEDDFRLVIPAIKRILKIYDNVKFYFLGGVPECVHAIDHKNAIKMNQWYDIIEYPSRMRQWQFDIGIAPLRDNNFNRSKSNLRWLEYSVMGIPSVVSRVEPFNRCVIEGKTGLFAYESDEWFEQMVRLIDDEILRQDIGAAARIEVEKSFDIRKNAKLWDKVYKRVLKEYKAEVRV